MSGSTSDATSAPNHLWLVGVLSTLLNGFGLFDFAMTQAGYERYMRYYPPDQRAFFYSFPVLMDAIWGAGMLAGFAGSILLLMRKREAVTGYAISLAGMMISISWQLSMSNIPESLTTPAMVAINMLIWITAAGLLIYAVRMRARGFLR